VFEDISPAAQQHFQIMPKAHLRDTSSLKREHEPLLKHMRQVAIQLLKPQDQTIKVIDEDD